MVIHFKATKGQKYISEINFSDTFKLALAFGI
jgi:hypothetical protein